MLLYVKKIWSTNPVKYKYIPLEKALKLYDEYLLHFRKEDYKFSRDFYSFENWLRNEI